MNQAHLLYVAGFGERAERLIGVRGCRRSIENGECGEDIPGQEHALREIGKFTGSGIVVCEGIVEASALPPCSS